MIRANDTFAMHRQHLPAHYEVVALVIRWGRYDQLRQRFVDPPVLTDFATRNNPDKRVECHHSAMHGI